MELPVITFIQTVLTEANPNFEVRAGTAHYDLFVQPQQLLLQPFSDFQTQRRVSQSVRLMALDPDPDSPTTFLSSDVDDLASNLFVLRNQGAVATAVVRVFYLKPKAIEFPALTAQFTAGSLSFFNSVDFSVTAETMALQTDGTLYYIDVPVKAEFAGASYNVAEGSITAILNDADAVKVINLTAAQAGLDAQTNTQLLNSLPNAVAVRDLETGKGINAILSLNFTYLTQIMPIGFGDPEMQRDIKYNTHVGGKTDVYLKTGSLTEGSATFNGLEVDTTRAADRNMRLQMARSENDPSLPSALGTGNIVVGSVVVKENITETAAVVSSVPIPLQNLPILGGIDLSSTQWINIQVDGLPATQIKVSGANPTNTYPYEIISAINLALGVDVASKGPGNTVVIKSRLVGAGSQIIFYPLVSPVLSAQNASQVLFGIPTIGLPATTLGVVAASYIETVDYDVDYEAGLIYQTAFSSPAPRGSLRQTITSGQTMISGYSSGQISLVGGKYRFVDSTANAFKFLPLVCVRPGDQLTITSINGSTSGTVVGISIPATYTVGTVIDSQNLTLSGFEPTGTTAINSVVYSVVSEQVVSVSYKYNPVSIDVGNQVVLDDSVTRGIRPGRESTTIKDLSFVKITSIQEVDPSTGESIGDPLLPPQGFGKGGFGMGGFGVGNSGDYRFLVNDPTTRYSAFEDSVILFSEDALGLSYKVSYLYNPEIAVIHNFCRNDTERVTGADVLVKTFIPAFVDLDIQVRRDPTNLTTPSNANLAILLKQFIELVQAPIGLTSTAIEAILLAEGILSVVPFSMRATVLNPDGSTRVLESADVLIYPSVTLESQTDNYTTKNITHFFAGVITVSDAT